MFNDKQNTEFTVKNNNRVTLKDISHRLGISPTTVANALKGNCHVSDELRVTILAEAEKMGYKPNFTAKAMVKNGISIALMMTEEPVEYVKYLRRSILNEIEKLSDFKVSLTEYIYHDNASTMEAYDCVERLVKHKYDGILFGLSFENESYIELIKNYAKDNPETKIVYTVYNEIKNENMPCICQVSVDSEAIGRIVAQLIYMTYGRNAKVGVITTSLNFGCHKITVDIFLEECRKYGIEVVDVLMNNDSKIETYACTGKLISEHPDIDVIYMTSFDSVQVCRCIENKGFKDKIKVIAHDVYNGMIPYMQNGQLIASIYQNQDEIGRTCVRTLFDAIMGEYSGEKSINIHPEIVLSSNLDTYISELMKVDRTLLE